MFNDKGGFAGVMNIDEFEDYLELRDPKIRAHIAQSRREFLAGKSRPFEEFLKELDAVRGLRANRRARQRADVLRSGSRPCRTAGRRAG